MSSSTGQSGGHLYQLATVEAVRLGDRTVDTNHLVLAILAEPDSDAAIALGTDLATAREASAVLDRGALARVGISLSADPPPISSARAARLRLTPAASHVLSRLPGVNRTGQLFKRALEAILLRDRPDRASVLLDALKVDRAAVRARLGS